MSSRGIQASGGMGREMAKLVSENVTDIDMFSYDLTRFQKFYVGDDTWRKETVHEGEVRTYWCKVPTLQRLAGRNLRFRSQSFPSLMADLCQDITGLSSFSRCLNGTFS